MGSRSESNGQYEVRQPAGTGPIRCVINGKRSYRRTDMKSTAQHALLILLGLLVASTTFAQTSNQANK